MTEIEKMERYIERTKLPPEAERYDIMFNQIRSLYALEVSDIVTMAFEYGRAKGYRMAKAVGKA